MASETSDERDAKYPEHAKLRARKADARLLSAFLDDLEESGLVICEADDSDNYYSTSRTKADLIGAFLGVDPDALSREKDAMYQEMVGIKL